MVRYIGFVLVFCLLAAAVGATSNTILSPVQGQYQWQEFILNVSTNVSANCTYDITWQNGTLASTGPFDGNGTQLHNATINTTALDPGYNYSISTFCHDSGDTTLNSTNTTTFLRDYVCGESVHSAWTLGHSLSCASDGLTITGSNLQFSCNNLNIRGSSGDGIAVQTVSAVNVSQCIVNGFTNGVVMQDVTNVRLQQSTVENNTLGFADQGNLTQVNISANYWGHSTCSLFMYGRDGNSTTVIDQAPLNESGGNPLQCTNQTSVPVFTGSTPVDIRLPTGADTAVSVSGFSYFYNETNEQTNISNNPMTLNGRSVEAHTLFTYFYVPGDDIIFDINITPAYYRFINFTIQPTETGAVYESFDLFVTNLSGVNGSAGVYTVNLTNYVLNRSHQQINVSGQPEVMDIRFAIFDDRGEPRWFWFQAMHNFSASDNFTDLRNDTTNWRTDIADFTDINSLVFHAVDPSTNQSIIRIEFIDSINMADLDFTSALRSFGTNMQLTNGSAFIDGDDFNALNKTANITFYNVNSSLNASELLTKILLDGSLCPADTCGNASYDSTREQFSIVVSHWSNYTLDTTAPTISDTSPSGTLAAGTTTATLSATTDEDATCKYDTTDVTYASMNSTMNGTETTHNASVAVTNGQSYTFYVRCQDIVNNTMNTSTTISFSVASPSTGGSSSGGSSSGGGGGSSLSGTELSSTPIRKLLSGDTYTYFKLQGGVVQHRIRVEEIINSTVRFRIESEPVYVTLDEGESTTIDVDHDGIDDMMITLIVINTYSVEVELATAPQQISETSEESEPEPVVETEPESAPEEVAEPEPAPEPVEEPDEEEESSWLWLGIFLIALVVGVSIYIVFRQER